MDIGRIRRQLEWFVAPGAGALRQSHLRFPTSASRGMPRRKPPVKLLFHV